MYTPAVEQAKRAAQEYEQEHHRQPLESPVSDPQRQALGEKLSGIEREIIQQEQERHELIEERMRKSMEEPSPSHSEPEKTQHDLIPPSLPPRVKKGGSVALSCCADFQLIPLGGPTPSYLDCMRAVEDVLRKLGVRYEVHEQSTIMHGNMADLCDAVRLSQEVVHALGCQRVISNVRFATRSDRPKEQ
ncbi:hypothetical protein EMPS_05664 [Entomortierella parvispora]|uniref:Thiamine-binding protein domain-containing protein n=1 Tax=Entomortierella parvispora TaxID=205924 RepID=A0A9P3HB22_9FUNG|nr:hypothetical protein EMPS_05664 [Entomortierella parvispora]